MEEQEWPDGMTEGESIELGPDDKLRESAVEWGMAIASGHVAVNAAKVVVDHQRNRIERDRVDLDRERLDFDRQQAERSDEPEG